MLGENQIGKQSEATKGDVVKSAGVSGIPFKYKVGHKNRIIFIYFAGK
jgi:hypothetical protein